MYVCMYVCVYVCMYVCMKRGSGECEILLIIRAKKKTRSERSEAKTACQAKMPIFVYLTL